MAAPRPLEGKLAVITGSSRGIGEAIARNLAAKGANLVLNYTSASSKQLAEGLAAELAKTHGVKTLAVQADVGGEPDESGGRGAASIAEAARAHFSTPGPEVDAGGTAKAFQIDILVNNAGIARNDKIADIKYADFAETYRVNVLGPLRMLQAALPHLPNDRSGRIINISSVSSAAGFVGQSIYGGSKAALEAMTRTWARELSERATVNAINPGPVAGPMYASNSPEFLADIHGWIERTPLMKPRKGVDPDDVVAEALGDLAKTGGGRPAYPSEVAGIVGMLCLEDAAWCTGQVVSANGGMLMQH